MRSLTDRGILLRLFSSGSPNREPPPDLCFQQPFCGASALQKLARHKKPTARAGKSRCRFELKPGGQLLQRRRLFGERFFRACPAPSKSSEENFAGAAERAPHGGGRRPPLRCFYCDQLGHMVRDCPKAPSAKGPQCRASNVRANAPFDID